MHRQFCTWMLAVSAAWGASAGAQPAAAPKPPPPAEAFFRVPDIEKARLSPDGKRIAVASSLGGKRTGLAVIDIANPGKAAGGAGFGDADIYDFEWVNDDRLVFEVADRTRGGGDQVYASGLFSVRPDGSELRMLVRIENNLVSDRASIIRREPLSWNHDLLHVPGGGGDEVVVGELVLSADRRIVEAVRPKMLNVVDGRTRSLSGGAPDHTFGWHFDDRGQPRLATSRHQGRTKIYWKPAADAPWQEVADHDSNRRPFTVYGTDAESIYVGVSEGAASARVVKRFDLAQRRPVGEALVAAPGFDISGDALVAETPGGKLLGIRLQADAETTVWFDQRMKALQQEADKRLPGRINRLTCRRCGDSGITVLIESWSDQDPGVFIVHRPETGRWDVIARRRGAIDPREMGIKDFHRVKARDGRDLPVWVTLPPGKAPATPRPAVVLVHGGPWVRGSTWRWDGMAQFLATRGYIVIEPEFRGSAGYGAAHQRAGDRQWGLAMQDDVADALQWAVGKGWVDGRRVCISGGSYGGYATLMGLVRHPELYRCGAASFAVTDLQLMFQWQWITDQSDEIRQFDYPTLIGDPKADAARLAETSPLNQAARIKAPVMLAMGGADRRVPIEHGTKMRDALRSAGNDPEWVVYPDEGHGFFKLENRIDYAERLERFLAKHLKASD